MVRHRIPSLTATFAVVTAVVGLATATGADVPLTVQLVVLAVLVVVVGLPHGALDPLVARRAGLVDSAPDMGRYLAGYVALAAATAVVWWWFPGPALAIFLVVSAVHFGGDWPALGRSARVVSGAAVVCAPIAFHPGAAQELLAPLSSDDAAGRIVDVVGVLAPVVLLSALLLVVVHHRDAIVSLELGLVMAISWSAPPLVAFTVYFCALHSPRHIGDVLARIGIARRDALRTALLFTSLTVVSGLVVWWALPSSATAPDDTLIRILVIGLAALTVPHMRTIRQARRRREGDRPLPSPALR